MQYKAESPDNYISQLPEDRKEPIKKLREIINKNLSEDFEEGMLYNMLGFYVPHSVYLDGYHCNPKTPLPFMNLASQKNFIAVYHMGMYAKKELLDWFITEYSKHCKYKLDMGKAFAKKLRGFDVEVLCYDIKNNVGDENCTQVSLKELQEKAGILSLHTPETPLTINMINESFINQFKNPFWLINTARGKSVVTKDLVLALKSGKVLGAGLDVLEYEKSSFENLFSSNMPEAFQYLIKSKKVLLTPHVAGWTIESKEKLAQTIVDKIKAKFC